MIFERLVGEEAWVRHNTSVILQFHDRADLCSNFEFVKEAAQDCDAVVEQIWLAFVSWGLHGLVYTLLSRQICDPLWA